jgi:hypothetical protein
VVGGRIAQQARQQLEQQTGRSVVTGNNYLPPAGTRKTVPGKKVAK